MSQLFTNNAASTLASVLSQAATSLVVQTGDGARFPSPTGGDYFLLTLTGANESSHEIVKCTARSGDTLTVERAQESTTDVEWAAGSKAELRITAGTMGQFTVPPHTGTMPPTDGNPLWFNSETGQLLFEYNDGDSTQWVNVAAGAPLQPSNYIDLGDITNATIAPIKAEDRIYRANLTGDLGTLTIDAFFASEYAACMLVLTGANDYEIGVAGTPKWLDGAAVALAPAAGETISLLVESINGDIHLSARTTSVPA